MTLYASDLDGTLLRSDMTISDETVEKLNRLMAKGVLFTYASARSFSSASPLVKKLNLSCPAVTFNGVFVVDPKTGEHIIENVFGEETLRIACGFFREKGLAPLVYSYIDGRERVSYLISRIDEVSSYVNSRKKDKRMRPVNSYDELFEGRVFYFTLLSPGIPLYELDEVFSRENGFSRNVMNDTYDPETVWYEIFSKDASKASALLQLLEYLHEDRLVCFGDNTNDLSMILAADTGVAVSNAAEVLKANADVVIGSNDEGAVADYIWAAENMPAEPAGTDRFSAALSAAMLRQRGMHGSVGTQNEKLIHAALKNYYVPEEYSQEIRIGKFIADAVCEDGIIEIQTRSLHSLKEKLRVFTEAAHVTVVHPIEAENRTIYISESTGEILRETPFRKSNPKLKIFEELYSIREYLRDSRVSVILVRLKTDKRVFFTGSEVPDLRIRSVRKKVRTEKVPLEILEEIRLCCPDDYARWLPKKLPESFTKKEFCAAAKESTASLRLEVLRAAGLIVQTGTSGKSYVYSLADDFTEAEE